MYRPLEKTLPELIMTTCRSNSPWSYNPPAPQPTVWETHKTHLLKQRILVWLAEREKQRRPVLPSPKKLRSYHLRLDPVQTKILKKQAQPEQWCRDRRTHRYRR